MAWKRQLHNEITETVRVHGLAATTLAAEHGTRHIPGSHPLCPLCEAVDAPKTIKHEEPNR